MPCVLKLTVLNVLFSLKIGRFVSSGTHSSICHAMTSLVFCFRFSKKVRESWVESKSCFLRKTYGHGPPGGKEIEPCFSNQSFEKPKDGHSRGNMSLCWGSAKCPKFLDDMRSLQTSYPLTGYLHALLPEGVLDKDTSKVFD